MCLNNLFQSAQDEIESARLAAVEELWRQAGDLIQQVAATCSSGP
jgi:F0F1-type ATP synthase membrane subunit b/b'